MTLYREHVARLPRKMQHLYYMITACRALPFQKWVAEGEPNPFVAKRTPRRPVTVTQSVMMLICEVDQPEVLQKSQRADNLSLAA